MVQRPQLLRLSHLHVSHSHGRLRDNFRHSGKKWRSSLIAWIVTTMVVLLTGSSWGRRPPWRRSSRTWTRTATELSAKRSVEGGTRGNYLYLVRIPACREYKTWIKDNDDILLCWRSSPSCASTSHQSRWRRDSLSLTLAATISKTRQIDDIQYKRLSFSIGWTTESSVRWSTAKTKLDK